MPTSTGSSANAGGRLTEIGAPGATGRLPSPVSASSAAKFGAAGGAGHPTLFGLPPPGAPPGAPGAPGSGGPSPFVDPLLQSSKFL